MLALSEASDSTIQGLLSVNCSCQHIGSCRLCSENRNFCNETNTAKSNLAVALLVIMVGFCTDSRGYELGNGRVEPFDNLFRYSY